MNPSKVYYTVVDYVLLYLNNTSLLSLEISRGSDLVVASDILFIDNTINYKSS